MAIRAVAAKVVARGIVACAAMAACMQLAAQTTAPWMMVTPKVSPAYRLDLSTLFLQNLPPHTRTGVQIHRPTHNMGEEALAWSLQHAPQQKSIVLMSEELALIGDAAAASPRHLRHYAPLLVVLETHWCLFAKIDSPLAQAEHLIAWVKAKQSPPEIAIPVLSGRLRLWVQGMAERTQSVWNMQAYGVGGDPAQALRNGADVALGRCDQSWRHTSAMRILAKSTKQAAVAQPFVPEFSDLGWTPLGNGWVAWFAPLSIPQAERDAMAQALYAASRSPHIQSEIIASGQAAVDMSPAVSAQYIDSFARTWNEIGRLLLGSKFGDLQKMAGQAGF